MAGIIGAALAGAAEGGGAAIASQGKAWTEKQHQDALNEAQALRTRSLAELQGEIQRRLETEVRQPFQTTERQAGEKHQTTLQKTQLEAAAEENRLNREVQREGQALQARQVTVLERGANLDNQIKQITLNNAKEVQKLRAEFPNAAPARQKQITEIVNLLTGKDNDFYLPVPLKDELGNITGYEIFDRRRGEFVNTPRRGGTAGGTVDWSQFSRPGVAPGAATAPDTSTRAPVAPGISLSPRSILNALMRPTPPRDEEEEIQPMN